MRLLPMVMLLGFASTSLTTFAQEIAQQYANELQELPENTALMTPRAAAMRNRIAVKSMSLNADGSAQLRGKIVGLGMDVYRFSGNAGDVIRVTDYRGSSAFEFAIFRPELGMKFGNHQVLPVSGDYELRIVNNRRNLPASRKAYPYHVKFALISDGSASAQTLQPITQAAPVMPAPAAAKPEVTVMKETPAAEPIPVMPAAQPAQQTSSNNNVFVCANGSGTLTVNFMPNDVVEVDLQGKNLVLNAADSRQGYTAYTNGQYVLFAHESKRHVAALIRQDGQTGIPLASDCRR